MLSLHPQPVIPTLGSFTCLARRNTWQQTLNPYTSTSSSSAGIYVPLDINWDFLDDGDGFEGLFDSLYSGAAMDANADEDASSMEFRCVRFNKYGGMKRRELFFWGLVVARQRSNGGANNEGSSRRASTCPAAPLTSARTPRARLASIRVRRATRKPRTDTSTQSCWRTTRWSQPPRLRSR